jgi:hypothetical protein
MASLGIMAAALAAIALGASTAQGQHPMANFQLTPGVLVDPNRGEAYVMSPEGGIVALDLAKGEQRWRSAQASKPLTLAGDLLIGQAEDAGSANALKIVTLDISKGGEPVIESLLGLPPGVQPTIAPSSGRSFTASAQPVGDEATITWEFVERPLRGVPPGPLEVLPGESPPGVAAAAPADPGTAAPSTAAVVEPATEATIVRGAARLNLSSGAASPTITPQREVAPAGAVPSAAFAVTASDIAPGTGLPGVPEPQFASADGRHVLSSERVDGPPARDIAGLSSSVAPGNVSVSSVPTCASRRSSSPTRE